MPIYPGRRPGTLRVTVYSGKQHEWIFQGGRRAAKQFEEERRAELRARPVADRGEPTFSTFCVDHYRPHAEMHLGARTWRTVRIYQVRALAKHFGDLRLSRVHERIEKYKQSMLERKRQPSYINQHLVVLHAILNLAREAKLLAAVPSVKLLPTSGKMRVRVWTMADVRKLYAAASPRMERLLHFLLDTGVRKGEAIAALWSWVDWDAGMLRIPVTREWGPKSKRCRDIPLSRGALAMLRKTRGEPEQPIFARPDGQAYKKFPETSWSRLLAKAKVVGAPHWTRHTYASHFLAGQPDLGLLAEVMGHSQLRVTEMYAHMLPDRLQRARDVVQLGPPSKLWRQTLAAAR